MSHAHLSLPSVLTEIRRQLALSQEDLARQLGVSFVTVNRWEKGHSRPSKLASAQLSGFCAKMVAQGRLTMAEELPV